MNSEFNAIFKMKFSATYFKRANETNIPKITTNLPSKKDLVKEKVKKQKNAQSFYILNFLYVLLISTHLNFGITF